MLALDDQALARLVIAACAVPPEERGAWLVSIAERAQVRRRSNERVRRCRQRQAAGVACLRIPVDLDDAAFALMQMGLLPRGVEHSREDVERALAEQLADWFRGWREAAP